MSRDDICRRFLAIGKILEGQNLSSHTLTGRELMRIDKRNTTSYNIPLRSKVISYTTQSEVIDLT